MVWNNLELAVKRDGSKFEGLEVLVCCLSNLDNIYEAQFMADAETQGY